MDIHIFMLQKKAVISLLVIAQKKKTTVIVVSGLNGTDYYRFRLWERCDGLHVESMCLHKCRGRQCEPLYR